MTEINDKKEEVVIHWTGFWISLISAPVLISAAILTPLYVLDGMNEAENLRHTISGVRIFITIGVTLYFVIGTPVLIYHLRWHAPRVGRIVGLSLLSVLGMLPLGAVFSLVSFDPGALLIAGISTCFGLIGAPFLAALFTVTYQRFCRT